MLRVLAIFWNGCVQETAHFVRAVSRHAGPMERAAAGEHRAGRLQGIAVSGLASLAEGGESFQDFGDANPAGRSEACGDLLNVL